MSEDSDFKGDAVDLMHQFERFLESDPLIDEIGFVDPSQFSMLNEEARGSEMFAIDGFDHNTDFWLRDHKLGISTHILLPLYKATRDKFMGAIRDYKKIKIQSDTSQVENYPGGFSFSANTAEREVMKHSKALLLLSSDFGTAWNSRKLIVTEKQGLPVYMDELLLSALVLSYFPKSECAWSHRRWVIKLIGENCLPLQEIVGKESELVARIAEKSKMNYRAWNHRCWLVSSMSRDQVLHELKETRNWAGLHVADNCCFHYRRRLVLRILENSNCSQENASSHPDVEIYQVWKEELEWDEMLIKRYIGREALWLHRRFLSLYWIKYFASDPTDTPAHGNKVGVNNGRCFMDYELNLLNSCLTIPDDDFEDYQQQAVHSATYVLWLIKQLPESWVTAFQEKLKAINLEKMLNKACPKKCLWESAMQTSDGCV